MIYHKITLATLMLIPLSALSSQPNNSQQQAKKQAEQQRVNGALTQAQNYHNKPSGHAPTFQQIQNQSSTTVLHFPQQRK